MTRKSESIKVVFRVRPLNSKEKNDGRKISTIAHERNGVIEVRNPSPDHNGDASKTFSFDSVFSEHSTQRQIYDTCAAPVVSSVLDGYNGTIFAYGQTGAGKTHTSTYLSVHYASCQYIVVYISFNPLHYTTLLVEGENDPASLKGIIPLTFEHVFDHIALNSSKDKYLVRSSYYEIYNEEIRDLLSQTPQRSLELKSADTGVYVKDLTGIVVKSVEEIDNVLQRGKKNRSVGATLMNAGSSRSHSIFSIVVECCSTDDDQNERIRVGKLNLVDLAGSERQSKTGATGTRLKEATKINLSLSALGNVISALVDGKSSHIPYRDSKLTRILQDSLGGNTKTVMCANAGPADYNYDESLSTLRYANRAKNIKNRPVINEDPKDAMLKEYQDEISRLRKQLSQMSSTSSTSNAANNNNEVDKENLQSQEMISKLRLNQDQSAEERSALQKKLDDEKKARVDTENQRINLEKQLKKMEAELMIGGEIVEEAAKQEATLRQANQDLIAKQEKELALTRQLNENEEEKLHLEEKYSSLSEEVASKTKKLKKVWSKYQQNKAELKDLEHEFLDEKNDMLASIRELTKQIKLKDFIISNFIPPKVCVYLD